MKKTFPVLLITFMVLVVVTLMLGCAGLTTQTEVENKYGPPAKKEVVNDKVIYYYYFSGRRARPPYERYNVCLEFTFDKDGKVVNERKYFPQPTPEKSK